MPKNKTISSVSTDSGMIGHPSNPSIATTNAQHQRDNAQLYTKNKLYQFFSDKDELLSYLILFEWINNTYCCDPI
jgi:hypothetical protein